MSDLIRLEEYFDEIYCINLKTRPDRLSQFKTNYGPLGTSKINIVKAVNGKEIDPGDWQHSPGALGCRLSHLNIYKEALYKGYSRILVLEDDVVMSKKARPKLAKLISYINDDWDMIYFGGTHCLKPDAIGDGFVKLNNTLSTHAIAINCRSLGKMIRKIENDKRWIDSVIGDMHQEMKVYGFKKALAWQRDGFSDIAEMNLNYNPKWDDRLKSSIKDILRPIYYFFRNPRKT
jgi:hypothetical protein